jgi:hypothetical protein
MAAKKDSDRPVDEQMESNPHPHHDWIHRSSRYNLPKNKPPVKPALPEKLTSGDRERRESRTRQENGEESRYRSHSRPRSHRSHSSVASINVEFSVRDTSVVDGGDGSSLLLPIDWDDDMSSDGEEDDQDIQELWFPGGHGDIGGGWDIQPGEVPLSHVPLVWIVHEAQRSGLSFDPEKMEIFDCLDDSKGPSANDIPTIELSTAITGDEEITTSKIELGNKAHFKAILRNTINNATVHDSLRFGGGLAWGGTLRWKLMEFLPFRRLDLGDNGKWKPIRWFVSLPTHTAIY